MRNCNLAGLLTRALGSFLLVTVASSSAFAQEAYPDRPIRMVVGFGAGGAVDIGARALAESAGRHLGRPILVENVTGAGGGLALADLARKPTDGYTVAVTTSSYAAITSQLQKPTFDMAAIETLLGVAEFRHVMFAKGDSPMSKLADVSAAARSANGFRFSHLGAGTSLHIQGYLTFKTLGIEPIQVPYRGAPEMITAILGGHSDMGIADISAVDALLKGGKLRLVSAATRERLKEFPEVPTLLEQGVQGADTLNPILGVVLRKGIPEDRVAKLREAFRKAAQSPEFAAAVSGVKMQVRLLQPQEFDSITQQASRAAAPVIEAIKRAEENKDRK
jgi:tripartite-type tricarboxylate transporter receptor subunit TctC